MGVTHSLPLLTGEQDRESPDPGSPGRAGGEERRTAAGCRLYARSLLFVAGDLERKSGADLLHAVGDLPDIEVDLVTSGKVEPPTGVHCRVQRRLRTADRALQDLYRTADVFAMPSRGDCMPQALAEAAAAGLALLSTPVGAIPEILHDGCNGLLVPVGSSRDMRDTLRRLATNPGLRHSMGPREPYSRPRGARRNCQPRRIFDLMAASARIGVHTTIPAK